MNQICPRCQAPTTGGLYIAPIDAKGNKLACFACVPDEQKNQYPGWSERETARRRRSTLAINNFGRKAEQPDLFGGAI